MDIESIEGCWRREAELLPPRLEEGTVLRMIEARAAALRRSLRGRLHREAGYYLPMMILSAATLLSGFTLGRLLAASAVVALVGVVVATLWRVERRIQEAPLDRSVRESLASLAADVDAAARAYAAAYFLVFAVSAAALTCFVWWRHGAGLLLVAALAGSSLAVAWSRRSGRSYAYRMFRRYRAELADCLGQLENETLR